MRTMITMAAMLLATAVSASALTWNAWHPVTLPNGSVDAVRVAHTSRATYCDFAIHNNLDVKLIGIGLPYQACVPTKNV